MKQKNQNIKKLFYFFMLTTNLNSPIRSTYQNIRYTLSLPIRFLEGCFYIVHNIFTNTENIDPEDLGNQYQNEFPLTLHSNNYLSFFTLLPIVICVVFSCNILQLSPLLSSLAYIPIAHITLNTINNTSIYRDQEKEIAKNILKALNAHLQDPQLNEQQQIDKVSNQIKQKLNTNQRLKIANSIDLIAKNLLEIAKSDDEEEIKRIKIMDKITLINNIVNPSTLSPIQPFFEAIRLFLPETNPLTPSTSTAPSTSTQYTLPITKVIKATTYQTLEDFKNNLLEFHNSLTIQNPEIKDLINIILTLLEPKENQNTNSTLTIAQKVDQTTKEISTALNENIKEALDTLYSQNPEIKDLIKILLKLLEPKNSTADSDTTATFAQKANQETKELLTGLTANIKDFMAEFGLKAEDVKEIVTYLKENKKTKPSEPIVLAHEPNATTIKHNINEKNISSPVPQKNETPLKGEASKTPKAEKHNSTTSNEIPDHNIHGLIGAIVVLSAFAGFALYSIKKPKISI